MPTIPGSYYQQFDADFSRDVPAEGFNGWKKVPLDISFEHTALVVMHAWDCGTREQFPGWHRVAEFIPRADQIVEKVFPPLLAAARKKLTVFHVVAEGEYYKQLPGYKRAVELAGTPAPPLPQVDRDPSYDTLQKLRYEDGAIGAHNLKDVQRGFARLDFPAPARPRDNEGVAENAQQLFALCKAQRINHLIYIGFAINWCLLMSPGGMLEMRRHGLLCSTIPQAVTAVENKDSARRELAKQLALWRVGMVFGFVFDLEDMLAALAV